VYAAASEAPLSRFMTVGILYSGIPATNAFGDRLRNDLERALEIFAASRIFDSLGFGTARRKPARYV